MRIYKELNIKINDLNLDPNNPRLLKNHDETIPEELICDKETQERTYKSMLDPENNFEIEELAKSIKRIGYQPVDRLFVKKINKKEKYFVIEGNRRLAAILYLLSRHKEGRPKDILGKDVFESIEKIECVDLTSFTKKEIDEILGLRHLGSIKDWAPLPASSYVYRKYMELFCEEKEVENKPENFSYLQNLTQKVGELTSVRKSKIKNQLFIYRVYLQILDEVEELDKNIFSIIEETINKKTLRDYYEFDSSKATFSEDGLMKFIDLCIKNPVITEATAGESTVRNFAYVVGKGTSEDIERIEKDRVKAGNIEADIKSKLYKKNLFQILDGVIESLKTINIGDLQPGEQTPREIKKFKEIRRYLTVIGITLDQIEKKFKD